MLTVNAILVHIYTQINQCWKQNKLEIALEFSNNVNQPFKTCLYNLPKKSYTTLTYMYIKMNKLYWETQDYQIGFIKLFQL